MHVLRNQPYASMQDAIHMTDRGSVVAEYSERVRGLEILHLLQQWQKILRAGSLNKSTITLISMTYFYCYTVKNTPSTTAGTAVNFLSRHQHKHVKANGKTLETAMYEHGRK